MNNSSIGRTDFILMAETGKIIFQCKRLDNKEIILLYPCVYIHIEAYDAASKLLVCCLFVSN